MPTQAELTSRLQVHIARLESGELSGRVRKRILAKIGGIKRELADMCQPSAKTGAGAGAGASMSDHCSGSAAVSGVVGKGKAAASIGSKRKMSRQDDDMMDSDPPHSTAAVASEKPHSNCRLISERSGQSKPPSDTGGSSTEGKRRRMDGSHSYNAVATLSRAVDADDAVDDSDGPLEMTLGPPTGKAKRKKKIKHVNAQLAQLAQRKQLAAALRAFSKAQKKGLIDAHSYANLMNAYVRCGDIDGSTEVLGRLRARGLSAGVVHYTVQLKGLCEAGRIREAAGVLATMSTEAVSPNLRTLNTFLRGCVRAGETTLAVTAFQQFRAEWGVEPDASSYEALGTLLAHELQLTEQLELIQQLRAAAESVEGNASLGAALAGEADAASNPAMYLACARTAALLGEWRTATEALVMARVEMDDDRFLRRQHSASADAASTGGRERARSMRQFARHRLEELKREAEVLEAYVDQEKAHGDDATAHIQRLLDVYRRVLHFGPVYTPVLSESVVAHLVSELGRFGFRRASELSKKAGTAAVTRDVAAALQKCVGDEGRIDLGELFPKPSLPLKLELCAGSGEWAAAQAAARARRGGGAEANWVALELRTDRVHDCFAHAVFGRLDNLAVIGGDAAVILEHHLPQCAHSIYINHPEPPERTGGADDSEGRHLLTHAFFEVMKRVLAPGGHITLVTDNLPYGKSLAETASDAGYRSMAGATVALDGLAQSKEVGAVHLLEGLPGPEYGHSTEASSYFDRMWAEGNKMSRYWFAACPPIPT